MPVYSDAHHHGIFPYQAAKASEQWPAEYGALVTRPWMSRNWLWCAYQLSHEPPEWLWCARATQPWTPRNCDLIWLQIFWWLKLCDGASKIYCATSCWCQSWILKRTIAIRRWRSLRSWDAWCSVSGKASRSPRKQSVHLRLPSLPSLAWGTEVEEMKGHGGQTGPALHLETRDDTLITISLGVVAL